MNPKEAGDWPPLLRTLSIRTPGEQPAPPSDAVSEAPEIAPDLQVPGETQPLRFVAGVPARFEVARRIGQGGFGAVYEAYDREAGRPVAIKILRHVHPDSLFRFKQEFRVLASLRHPNLVELYDLFEVDDLWFFSMELVRGESFVSYVRPSDVCDFDRLRRAVGDLVRVLAFLHSRDLVHRDIKPDNVMVTEDGRLVLLDFGLARHLAPNTNSATVSVGTPAYMAPEQMSDVPVTPAADLYAVGTLIYVALTGKAPFEGSVLQVLTAKTSQDAVPPSSIVSGIPQDWERICCQLLNRNPEARPGASDLLSFLAGVPERPVADRTRVRSFVGRDDILRRMLEACSAGPAVIEVTGASGYGKTALLQTFANRVIDQYPAAVVIRGCCYEHESLPFKAIDALVDDLSRQLQRMGSSVRDLLPNDIGALARLFPVLRRVDSVAALLRAGDIRIANPTELRRRAFIAFSELIERMSRDHLPVICLDDVQWGDGESAALFQCLYSRQPVPAFILVTSHRSGMEGEFVSLLRRHTHAAASHVSFSTELAGPLDLRAATEIAVLLLEQYGIYGEDAEALAADSQGNPLLLEQMIASIARQSTTGIQLRNTGVPELVLERVARLSASAREFLQMLACFGEPMPEPVAVHLSQRTAEGAGRPDSEVISTIVSQQFVRVREARGVRELEIYHDQIRAALVDAIPEDARRCLHVRLADALISASYEDPGTIAVQLARGGDELRAAEYSERAAEAAEKVFGFDRAAHFYGMALALGRLDGPGAAVLRERLAKAYAAAGRDADSARAYEEAARLADSRALQMDLRRRAAEEWIRGGNLRHGVDVLMSLGREFRIRHTDSTAAALLSIAVSRMLLRVRGLKYRERPEPDISTRDLARLDLHWALTAGLSMWNPVLGAAYQLRHLRLALTTGEPRRIGLAFATEAAYRCLRGESAFAGARSLLNQSMAIASLTGDPVTGGTAQAMSGMCGWLTGRWDVARDSGLEAERTLREHCTAVPWQLSIARNAVLGGLLWSGDWKDYAVRLSEWTHDAENRGDLSSLSVYRMNHCPLSLAADAPDQAASDLQEAERILAQAWSGRGFHVPHFFGVFGRSGVVLYQGRVAEELETLEQSLRRLRRSLLQRIEFVRVLTTYIEATLAIAAASESHSQRRGLLRKAAARAGSLRGMRAIWGLAMAMLIEAGIEAALGHTELAAARWADAERELRRCGMRMYATAAQFCRGLAIGDTAMVQAASAAFHAQGVVSPGRFTASLVPGIDSRDYAR